MSQPQRSKASLFRIASLAMFLLAGWAVTSAPAAEPLRWQFTAGDSHHFQMNQEMKMQMQLPTGNVSTTMNQIIDMTWDVTGVDDDGIASVQQKINRMRMRMAMPQGQQIDYDSSSDAAPQGFAAMLAPMMKEMTKAVFDVKMSPQGEILEVAIPEGLIKALKGSPAAQMMGDMASEEGFKQMIEKGSLKLPETLEKGVTWDSEVKLKNPMFGTQTVTTTYEYIGPREVDGQVMEVFSPTLNMEFGDGAGANGAQIEVTGQKSEGEILFNRNQGFLESSQINMGMDLKIKVAGQEINQAIDQKISLKHLTDEQVRQAAEEEQAAQKAAEPVATP
jgi:hypothetical protein